MRIHAPRHPAEQLAGGEKRPNPLNTGWVLKCSAMSRPAARTEDSLRRHKIAPQRPLSSQKARGRLVISKGAAASAHQSGPAAGREGGFCLQSIAWSVPRTHPNRETTKDVVLLCHERVAGMYCAGCTHVAPKHAGELGAVKLVAWSGWA
jgi:hypothetical protein